MERLFKFVIILCVGTAILSIFIPTNRKAEQISTSVTLKEFIEKAKNFLNSNTVAKNETEPLVDQTLSKKQKTTLFNETVEEAVYIHTKERKKLSHAELFTKLEKEAGKEAIEYWINYQENELWGFELDKKGWDIWNKAGNIIKANYGTAKASWNDMHETVYNEEVSEFHNFVYNNKGWIETIEEESCDIWWHYGNTPTTRTTNNQQTTNVGAPPLLTETEIMEQSSKPKKDFSKTIYTDDFVKKYALDKKCVKTDTDRELAKKWDLSVREIANMLQQSINGYNETESVEKAKRYIADCFSYKAFASSDCQTELMVKYAQLERRMDEIIKTERL